MEAFADFVGNFPFVVHHGEGDEGCGENSYEAGDASGCCPEEMDVALRSPSEGAMFNQQ